MDYQLEYAIGVFGDELWQAMEGRGMNQAELARKAAVSRQFLTKVFRGDNNFTIETMVKLAHAVGHRLYQHLAPAEVDCEWQHFWKAEPAVTASISSADWQQTEVQKVTLRPLAAVDHEDIALAA
ncbi:MAG: helix-turn-helix domain-containing protein [Verrucomicrobiaceae bacterium]|nr:helix-turn-helix domain-containing protein [Verrucomicrobiaceae bacterium]